MPSWDNTSNNRLEEPATPIIPEPSRVINVILSIWLIPLTGFMCVETALEIKVPSACGSKVFLIRIGIFFLKTGWIVGGYNTLAPKCDNSIASWYEIVAIGWACLTIFGLAVNIPFTSVQISKSDAFNAPAIIAAV